MKKGQKEFLDIDLEGSFVNEDLSNLLFENCFIVADFTGANFSKTIFKNCNLKTCNFSYSNLEKAVFDGNCLEAADFRFAQYSELTLVNNSCYSYDFAKEMLEEMRDRCYPGLHIINVHVGWFEVMLVGQSKMAIVTASDYLGHDAPYELLKTLHEMSEYEFKERSITKWLCWDDEPGATIWKFLREDDKIKITIYSAKRNSFEINRASLENEEIFSTDIELEGHFHSFVKETIKSFEKIRDITGEQNYEKDWGSFPHEELKKLKDKVLHLSPKEI